MTLPFDSYWRVVSILETRGVSWHPNSFNLEDADDLTGLKLGRWDAALGPRPTDREITDAPPYVPLDPNIELSIALEAAFAAIEAATTITTVKAGLANLRAALLGTAGRGGRIAGRSL